MRYLYRFIQVVFLFFSTIGFSQTIESTLQLGGSKNDIAMNVAKDNAGNLYVVGSYSNVVDFNPNGIASPLEASNTIRQNVFVAKYDKNKVLLWIVPIGGGLEDRGSQLILDDLSNVYVTGYASGDLELDPSSGVNASSFTSSSRFILKLNNNGEFQAVQSMAGGYQAIDIGKEELFKDDLNNIYAYVNGELYKYDSNLDLLWTQSVGGFPELYNQTEIHVIEVILFLNGQIPDGTDIHLKKYNASTGNLISNTLIGHTEGHLINSIVQRAHNGDLLLYGNYYGALTFSGGGSTIDLENYQLNTAGLAYENREYICRYDGVGNLLWAKDFEDKGPNPRVLETDDEGYIYALGNLHYNANFDPVNPVTHTAVNQFSCYVAKYDSEFNNVSVSQFLGNHTLINDVQFYDNNMVVCGSFYPSIDVDITPATQILETNGIDDAYILEYSNFQSLSINDNETEDRFGILTNQSTGMVQVNINAMSHLNSEYKVSVLDINGRLLKSLNSGSRVINIDLSMYSESVYLIQVSNQNWMATEKVTTFN